MYGESRPDTLRQKNGHCVENRQQELRGFHGVAPNRSAVFLFEEFYVRCDHTVQYGCLIFMLCGAV